MATQPQTVRAPDTPDVEAALFGPGGVTQMFGMARKLATCSTGWWVGPSSPRPIE